MTTQKRTPSSDPLFKELARKILYLDNEHQVDVEKAFAVSNKAHAKQKRNTGEPYITHPVSVACILADLRMDHKTLMAALLHDTIEDTNLTKKDIENLFDNDVAMLVDGVTKLKHIKFNDKHEAQAEYLRKMLMAMSKDVRVIIVKLADRLHNMRTLYGVAPEKKSRIARETLDIYAPIARRVGMSNICLELEELGFKNLYPMRFKVLKAAVTKTQGDQTNYLNDIISSIQSKFKLHSLSIVSLSAREKHIYSIYKKMLAKRISFNDVNDVFGIRVVVGNKESCYLALCHIHELFKPVSGRFKDYIAMPKSNGYQSLHTDLFGPNGNPIEVQIRTQQMSNNAEIGLCSHWLYKARKSKISQQELKAQQWVRSLVEMQQQTGNSEEFLENVRVNLVPNDVYVFTPKGEIIELPSGSTIIDMAYAIHTEIGHNCVAAKIDKQLVPLSATLYSGVTVEIITSPTASPNLSYLGFVVTPKAKNSIRNFFKTRKRDQAILLGTRLLEVGLPQNLSDYDELYKQEIAKQLNYNSMRDILINVGLGFQPVADIVKLFEKDTLIQKIVANEEGAIPISGAEGLVMIYASCCYPIPGDPVNGFMKPNEGIVLHHAECKKQNAMEAKIPVYWSGMISGTFKTSITIYTENKQGLLATLALAIAEQKSSIEDVRIIPSSSSTIDVSMIIMVNNRNHLARIFNKLRLIKYVYRVKRNSFGE